MAEATRKKEVSHILQSLRSVEGLKRLFWEELNYDRQNAPLSVRGWPENARNVLAEDPVLFASGGVDGAFHVIYCTLKTEQLRRTDERLAVNQLLRDHPYALFVFSNRDGSAWHFLNVKYGEQGTLRRLFRRITVDSAGELRTAAERLQMLDLEALSEPTALAIQERHDDAFDVDKVTKDFYRELANWYFWAVEHVRFPKDAPKEDGRDHVSIIRLITRLVFCWFMKEKGLIPTDLFDERKLQTSLNGFAPRAEDAGTVYYRAILQNLFFATLNTDMEERSWAHDGQNFMAHTRYRHKECFQDPEAALAVFKDIPFLNGGLFECLDRDRGKDVSPRYVRVDGFSRRPDSQPLVPDFLFFGSERHVDLSAYYGGKRPGKTPVRGLIHILHSYRFTIEENTPFDQEVALDPELAGKIFENLLAAYNPETGATARKATGSYYTPREVVDYMVDEALLAYLSDASDQSDGAGGEAGLRRLLSWDEEGHGFSETEVERLVTHIDHLKALDPAVGSGAFPMGLLHKLVLVLGKLDPGNERWKQKQLDKLEDQIMREDAEELFRKNYDDYGRKLYLIENCIYGVDIQPIAVQIAKMRFFISLIVDQRVDDAANNRGVRALPNLETKFVAADTLMGIKRKGQTELRSQLVIEKEDELRRVRGKHFNAKTLQTKAKYRQEDKRLRAEIAELLKTEGWQEKTARTLAAWDPYDQNTSADFFDPEWMFGVREGFDIVIGNPPYVRVDEIPPKKREYYKQSYEAAQGKYDLYYLFLEIGFSFLRRPKGVLAFITPNRFSCATSARRLRQLMSTQGGIEIVSTSRLDVFKEVSNYPLISIFRSNLPTPRLTVRQAHGIDHLSTSSDNSYSIASHQWENLPEYVIPINVSQSMVDLVLRLRASEGRLGDFIEFSEGIRISARYERTEEAEYRIVKQYQFSRWTPIYDGSWICKEDLRKVLSFKTLRYRRSVTEKLIMKEDALCITSTLDTTKAIPQGGVYFGVLLVEELSLKHVLALLNSKMLSFLYKILFSGMHMGGGYMRYRTMFLSELPTPDLIKNSVLEDKESLVDQIMAAKSDDPKADVSALEREVDERVYRLYGLTAEEIRIVEEAQ